MPVKTNFEYRNSFIYLNDDITKNQLNINNVDYYAYPLDPLFKKNKGAHSFVFALFPCQDFDNFDNSKPSKVIKISNEHDSFTNGRINESSKNERFRIEINALNECKRKHVDNIIEIDLNDHIICTQIKKNRKGKEYEKKYYFPFYMMDYADADLKKYLENNELDKTGKIELCLQLAEGIRDLNNLGYYHRDIKPDNILFFNGNKWRIGDLGLVGHRDSDYDKKDELIGPKGWLSPEAMNKYLIESHSNKFDCIIDEQSDIFQLGKVFWYILQGNAPIGCIDKDDFLEDTPELYNLIRQMLNHSKKHRIRNMSHVISTLNCIIDKYSSTGH